ncbi:hypothetical protein [Edaphobacter aggregans]|uniref:hypothetical protein n=1 Tax=Edaphobacter aggregans TaxID=570835 RepID=UPI0012FBDF1F|nr:hypothetical protein [Edaphobacter aggregans]
MERYMEAQRREESANRANLHDDDSQQNGYEIDNGNYSYRFFCDGKKYPKIDRITVTCTRATATELDTMLKENGKIGAKSHQEISSDGKTLTQTSTRIHEDGTKETKTITFVRTSGLQDSPVVGKARQRRPQNMRP